MENTLNQNQVAEQTIALFQKLAAKPSFVITKESIISELFPSLDSLQNIDLIMKIEDEFDIYIPDEDVKAEAEGDEDYSFKFKLNTVGDFIDCVIKNLAEKLSTEKNELNFEGSE